MPVIPAFEGLRQKDHELEARLGYIANLCLKESKSKQANRNPRTQKQKVSNGYSGTSFHTCYNGYCKNYISL
jgi:hypothetical protein